MPNFRAVPQEQRITQSPVAAKPVQEQRVDDVDQASRDSFPASDPPSWNGVRLGAPRNASPASRSEDEGRSSS